MILKNIPYIPEYNEHGVKDRNFSIDIALPDKMVAIEINGNQHYNRDGMKKKELIICQVFTMWNVMNVKD